MNEVGGIARETALHVAVQPETQSDKVREVEIGRVGKVCFICEAIQ